MTDRERAQAFCTRRFAGVDLIPHLAAEFAAIRADERERCAKEADKWNIYSAAAIRAGGDDVRSR